mmetsp:Transcript_16387/g.38815  ORF Transcript_16387/g.38815 Transcript_16387/m.38815 type:complete len:214 (+) Transcript_16387:24-665(+)
MAAGLPSWSACWARSPSTPSPRRCFHAAQAGLTPAPTSPVCADNARRRRGQKETGRSDSLGGRVRKVQSPRGERRGGKSLADSARSPNTPKSASKVPWRPGGVSAPSTPIRSSSCSAIRRSKARVQDKASSSTLRPTYVEDGPEKGSEMLELLHAENRSLRALAARLQSQLAAVEESTLTYQSAAEELSGVWDDDSAEAVLGLQLWKPECDDR